MNKTLANMSEKIKKLNEREKMLFLSFRGASIPEANNELNNLQREIIAAVYEAYGKAFIGKVNIDGILRENLSVDSVFTEYTGQMVYNFGADFIIPYADEELAEMIVKWNTSGINAGIYDRVHEIGGTNLIWS